MLERISEFRDLDPNPNSGLPAAAVDWFWQEELPRLMQRPEMRVFAEERVSELNAKAVGLRQRIQLHIGSLQAEAEAAEAEAERILGVVRQVES